MWTGAGYRTSQMLWSPPPPSNPGMQNSHEAWHSPVPYLFGGLAAILAIIAFCLLMLACSYWKLSHFLQAGSQVSDAQQPDEKSVGKTTNFVEDQFVVIMAGDEEPTFMASRADANTNELQTRSDYAKY